MSKKIVFISSIFIIFTLSIGYFGVILPNTETYVEGSNHKETSEAYTLKSSATTVTSLRNYTTSNTITSIAISEDGNYIVVASSGISPDTLVLFNKSSTLPMWNVSIASGIAILDVAISSNGTYIAVGTEEGVLLFNNTYSSSKTPMWNYTLGDYGYSVAISANGKFIAVGSWDHNIYLFNNTYSTSKTPVWNFATQNNVESVAISADGTYITGGGWDDTIYFLNNTPSSSKTPMWSYNNTKDVTEVDISADGRYIVAALKNYFIDNGGNISYFDTQQKIRLWKYDHNPNYGIFSIDMSADGRYMVSQGTTSFKAAASAAGFFDNSIQTPKTSLWSVLSKDSAPKLSSDGWYAAVLYSQNVSLFDKASSINKEYIWSYQMDSTAQKVAISANSSYIVACEYNKVYLLYWDAPEHRGPIYILLIPDDDDDENEPQAISFGIYYLLFSVIATISLIVIIERKVLFNKK